MAIVFVHGVATRDEDDPQFPMVERFAREANWPVVEAMLREHVAPVVRPADPDGVAIVRVYWGDLGMRPRVPLAAAVTPGLTVDAGLEVDAGVEVADADSDVDAGLEAGLEAGDTAYPLPVALDDVPNLAALTPAELGEALQRELFEALPPTQWAAVVRAVWDVVGESALRSQLAARSPRRQRAFVDDLVRERLRQEDPALGRVIRPVRTDLVAQGRKGIRRAMGGVRRPFAGILPIFVGDILRYLDGRGRPGAPGPIIERVVDGLHEAAAAGKVGEPLVVLTHSMGGQLVYDTLTAFDPGVRVDFWCASGGQVGFFVELGVFLEATDPDARPFADDTVGYFWNAWSSSDVLSFPTEGRVPGAHDSDFAYDGTLIANHMSYLHDPAFYATLAAKVAVHTRGRRRHMGG
ncbi:MAG: hypothetical protein IPL93_12940 [Actinomycetales bacterium]|jgi:hypothetical protein|nr:hypothetical protein [Actinomycetales bacterium]